jgi:hypothetical protein
MLKFEVLSSEFKIYEPTHLIIIPLKTKSSVFRRFDLLRLRSVTNAQRIASVFRLQSSGFGLRSSNFRQTSNPKQGTLN